MDLIKVVEFENIEEVKLLLEDESLDVNYPNKKDRDYTSLHYSCMNGSIDIIKLLLKRKDINLNLQNNAGYTPFYVACEYGKSDVVKLLLEDSRVNVNLVEGYGWTPLMAACYGGKTGLVIELLKDKRVGLFDKTTKFYSGGIHGGVAIKEGSNVKDISLQVGLDESLVEMLDREIASEDRKLAYIKYQISSTRVKLCYIDLKIYSQKVIEWFSQNKDAKHIE